MVLPVKVLDDDQRIGLVSSSSIALIENEGFFPLCFRCHLEHTTFLRCLLFPKTFKDCRYFFYVSGSLEEQPFEYGVDTSEIVRMF